MIQAHINNTTRNGWTVVSICRGGMSRIHSVTYIGRIRIWEVSDYSRASSARLIIAMCDQYRRGVDGRLYPSVVEGTHAQLTRKVRSYAHMNWSGRL